MNVCSEGHATDSMGFTPFELIYGRSVRTPLSLLIKQWTEEEDDSEVKTAYQYVIELREKLEETCHLAQQKLSKVQNSNLAYYKRHARNRYFNVGDSVLLLLLGKIGDVDYRVEIAPGKVKTYHINMLKCYFHRHESMSDSKEQGRNNTSPGQQTEKTSKEQTLNNTGSHQSIQLQTDVAYNEPEVHGVLEQAAAVACVIEDNSLEEDTGATINSAGHAFPARWECYMDQSHARPALRVDQSHALMTQTDNQTVLLL